MEKGRSGQFFPFSEAYLATIMERLESDFYKFESDRLKMDEKISFKTSGAFKSELQDIAEEYNVTVSHLCRTAVVNLMMAEAKAAEGDLE